MPILVDENSRVLVQGITGREGSFHTREMLDYGTVIRAGVTPWKGGMKVYGVPVYDSVEEALKEHPDINVSIVFVPPLHAPDAVYEAVDAGVKLVIVITEHIPVHETLRFTRYARYRGARIVGPNTPGIISPGRAKVGIMPSGYFKEGNIGLISRSGTLMYEVSWALMKWGFGISTAIGLGGDQIVGLDMVEAARLFEEDPGTRALVVVGEIGGSMEELLAEEVAKGAIEKPLVAFIAGMTAPPGRKMGHAGAIAMGRRGTAESKLKAFENVNVPVARRPREVPELLRRLLESR